MPFLGRSNVNCRGSRVKLKIQLLVILLFICLWSGHFGKGVSVFLVTAYPLLRKVLHFNSIISHPPFPVPFFDALNTMLNVSEPVHSFHKLMLRVLASFNGPQVINLAPVRIRSSLPQTSSRNCLHSNGSLIEITLIQLRRPYLLDWRTCNRHSSSPVFLLTTHGDVHRGLAVPRM